MDAFIVTPKNPEDKAAAEILQRIVNASTIAEPLMAGIIEELRALHRLENDGLRDAYAQGERDLVEAVRRMSDPQEES